MVLFLSNPQAVEEAAVAVFDFSNGGTLLIRIRAGELNVDVGRLLVLVHGCGELAGSRVA